MAGNFLSIIGRCFFDMETFFQMIVMAMYIVAAVMFIYVFFQDLFNLVIGPKNNRLNERIYVLYRMGLNESADILKERLVHSWWDLLR